jgi:uncharacterized protein
MKNKHAGLPRRDFLKTLMAAGVGSLLGARGAGAAAPASAARTVPLRPFGKTGVDVPMLGIGGMFDILNNQLVMKQAYQWGVRYWDTADCYEGGRSEPGIGKFFESQPSARKDIFLVTKSDARDPAGMTKLLTRSLERMKTDYIDLYFLHGISGINELNENTQAWARRAKKEGKIRFFGFSTHSNMEDCLQGAARLGWVDGIMFTYNYRLMQKDKTKAAVDACAKAGIGLTAMKTQGGGQVKTDSPKELELAGRFLSRGFTEHQAKLKAVWENQSIATICSQMPSMSILTANIAAALDETKLTSADMEFLRQYAEDSQCGYCAGCGNICSSAMARQVPIGDVMRCLMYEHSYGDRELARSTFAAIPADARAQLAGLDFTAAEHACPHRIPIAELMKEASVLLA